METVSIRELRGTLLQDAAREGIPLAITNYRVLIGVFIPLASTAWLKHLINRNSRQVRDAIAEGEQAMAVGAPMTTLDELTPAAEEALASAPTIRVGQLTAGLIERAGTDGQLLTITHERQIVGIVIPVTSSLVRFLIEQNAASVSHSISLGEKQLRAPDLLTTLDDVSPDGTSEPGSSGLRPWPGGEARSQARA